MSRGAIGAAARLCAATRMAVQENLTVPTYDAQGGVGIRVGRAESLPTNARRLPAHETSRHLEACLTLLAAPPSQQPLKGKLRRVPLLPMRQAKRSLLAITTVEFKTAGPEPFQRRVQHATIIQMGFDG